MTLENFFGRSAPLTQTGFDQVATGLTVDAPSLWSLVTVETRGFGFLHDRRPKILYERHIFNARTAGRFSAQHPDISSTMTGGYIGGAEEYGRLERALTLDRQAALESASWGLGQIMGFNAVELGYNGVEEMIALFLESEDAQLDGSRRFIETNTALTAALRKKDWTKVAFFYNGKDFAKNNYHKKLERYHDLYKLKGTPNVEIRAAQARLTFLGFDPRGVDGILGDGTQMALIAFQKAKALTVTGDLDDKTNEVLRNAAGI